MPNHASCTIIGHLGRDAEIRNVGENTVLSWSMATTRKRKDKEITTWWRCQMWGERGIKLAPYLTKGKAVMVQGETYMTEYETKDGGKGVSLEVDVRDLVLLGDGGKRDEKPQETPQRQPGPSRPQARAGGGGFSDEEPPFSRSEQERMPF